MYLKKYYEKRDVLTNAREITIIKSIRESEDIVC